MGNTHACFASYTQEEANGNRIFLFFFFFFWMPPFLFSLPPKKKRQVHEYCQPFISPTGGIPNMSTPHAPHTVSGQWRLGRDGQHP